MSLMSRKRQTTSAPSSARKWPPSEQWDGIDGSWSTFIVSIGDDDSGSFGQDFRVLPSISGSAIYVPGPSEWCTRPTTELCSQARGIEPFNNEPSYGFLSNRSAAWNGTVVGNFTTGLAATFDYSDSSSTTFGFDNVGIGRTSVGNTSITLSQTIGVLETTDFFLGYIGLSTIPIGLNRTQFVPFLPQFGSDDTNNIPSQSYAYTAGASYVNEGRRVPGDLVLGGYDASRFNRATSIEMPSGTGNTTLVASVRSINVIRNNTQTIQIVPQDQAFSAVIDSTLPYLWLPDEACDALVREFNLQEDTATNLFTLSETARLNNQDARIEIQIGSDATSSTTIDLPYAAFDLEASWPLVDVTRRYFPIKRSPTNSYILGRAFLQEAYVVVDYVRRNFTIGQAVFDDPMPAENVISITANDFAVIGSAPEPTNPTDGGGNTVTSSSAPSLSGGEIAGIALGSVFLVIAAIFTFMYYRKFKLKRQQAAAAETANVGEIDGTAGYDDKDHPGLKERRASELEAPSERSSTVGGYYGHNRHGSDPSELDSPPMQSIPKFGDQTSYFASDLKRAPLADPNPNPYSAQLAELPAESNPAELRALSPTGRGRPGRRRNRSGGSNSRSDIGTPGERVTVIVEGDEIGDGGYQTYAQTHKRQVSGEDMDADTAHEHALQGLGGADHTTTSSHRHTTESRFTENMSDEPENLGGHATGQTTHSRTGSDSEPKTLGTRTSLPTTGHGLLSDSEVVSTANPQQENQAPRY